MPNDLMLTTCAERAVRYCMYNLFPKFASNGRVQSAMRKSKWQRPCSVYKPSLQQSVLARTEAVRSLSPLYQCLRGDDSANAGWHRDLRLRRHRVLTTLPQPQEQIAKTATSSSRLQEPEKQGQNPWFWASSRSTAVIRAGSEPIGRERAGFAHRCRPIGAPGL